MECKHPRVELIESDEQALFQVYECECGLIMDGFGYPLITQKILEEFQ